VRRLVLLQLGAALLALICCASAGADVFGPISLVSDNALEQADYAHDPAISANGEYVAFDGYFEGLTGVWRRDLKSDSVEPVAVGEPGTPGGSAELPSISENGQYISFTTTAALAPKNDTNKGPDVYVRNMDVPETEPCTEEEAIQPQQACAFTLASAVNGSTHGLSYEYPNPEEQEYAEGHYGAEAAGRSALSANGQELVFVTTAPSNLAGASTPKLQVAVRYLQTGQTELVSVEYDPATGGPAAGPEPVPVNEGRGAVYNVGGFESPQPYKLTPQAPASISADGSTVAWLGQNIDEQAPTLAGEPLRAEYTEPLWRRIGGGEEGPTRRVTGGADPTNPACVASGETVLPATASLSDPCQGPFSTTATYGPWTHLNAVESAVPRLSGDGYSVAFIAQAPLVAFGNDFGVAKEARNSDIYVVDMHEGLSRVQALTPLTELASGNDEVLATNASIIDFGISPDGNQVAFSTMRTQFVLGSPAYVSAPQAAPGMLELFDADLANGTLTRVTHGYRGEPSETPHPEERSKEDQYIEQFGLDDGALSPSFSAVGELLAFSSPASNLIFGDGNTPSLSEAKAGLSDGSDVFVIKRETFPSDPAPQTISGAPAGPSLTIPWSLGVTALRLANGSVRLFVEVPGTGILHAVASSRLVVRVAHKARVRGKAGGVHAVTTVASRNVAAATLVTSPGAGGLAQLTLTLTPSFRSLAARAGGLSAAVSVTFDAPGHPALRKSISVSFLRKAPAHKAAARKAATGEKGR
jgi:WD40-like Beta Propeller Repeat